MIYLSNVHQKEEVLHLLLVLAQGPRKEKMRGVAGVGISPFPQLFVDGPVSQTCNLSITATPSLTRNHYSPFKVTITN